MRRGMAAIIAVVMIALVGAALVTLGTVFASQVKRTRAAASEAQLRQLLVAGAVVATQMTEDDREIALPKELANDGATLHVKIHRDGDRATVEIVAKVQSRVLDETIRMEGRDGKWRIIEIVHDQPPASTQPSDRSTAASQRS